MEYLFVWVANNVLGSTVDYFPQLFPAGSNKAIELSHAGIRIKANSPQEAVKLGRELLPKPQSDWAT